MFRGTVIAFQGIALGLVFSVYSGMVVNWLRPAGILLIVAIILTVGWLKDAW